MESGDEPGPPTPPRPPSPSALPPITESNFRTARNTFVPVQVHFAINAADIEQVQELVAAGISLDYIIYANTPLTLAILKEHYDIAHVLLDGGANVNFPEQMAWKRLPLHLVAKDGRLDLVQKIVAKGGMVDAVDAGGKTALQWAATSGHTEVVKWLVQAGAQVNTVDDTGRSALFRATEGSYIPIVRLLYEAGAEVDTEDVYGWTPLFNAVVCNDYDLSRELLAMGASARHRNEMGKTVLHLIAHRLANDNLLTLCRTDSNFYIRDRQVSCAASKHAVNNPGYEVPITEMLLDAGAQVNLTDNFNRSALMVAAIEGNVDVMRLLVNAGADLRAETWIGDDVWPLKLAPCVETCQWLKAHWEISVRPLQELCRLHIREVLFKCIDLKINQLPLPTKVLDFLRL